MNLRSIIYKARSRGVPVYCIVLILVYLLLRYWTRPSVDYVPQHLKGFIQFNQLYRPDEKQLSSAHAIELARTLEVLNFEREVFNVNRFGLMRPDVDIVVVQVARNPERLQYLIVALAKCRYIQSVLLVFSHSYYDDQINRMIRKIKFTRFMQIFYPFSIQVYPKRFPGVEPFECQGKPEWRRAGNCTERDARLAERKHHWWWTAHFVFKKMEWSSLYSGVVIFLEEDDYVLPDLLYMLRYTKRTLVKVRDVHVMSFGRPPAKLLDYDLMTVDVWQPPFDRGLAFNKSMWDVIFQMASHYCMYDDVSWSYSLLNVFSNMRRSHVDVVACMAPRVVATGSYPSGRDAFMRLEVARQNSQLFPPVVRAVSVYNAHGRVDSGHRPPPRGNGGWSDIRDHLLCLESYLAFKDSSVPVTFSFDTTTAPLATSSFFIFPTFVKDLATEVMEIGMKDFPATIKTSISTTASVDTTTTAVDTTSASHTTSYRNVSSRKRKKISTRPFGRRLVRGSDVIDMLAHLPHQL